MGVVFTRFANWSGCRTGWGKVSIGALQIRHFTHPVCYRGEFPKSKKGNFATERINRTGGAPGKEQRFVFKEERGMPFRPKAFTRNFLLAIKQELFR